MRIMCVLVSVFTILAGYEFGFAQTLHVINIADTRKDTDNYEGFAANFESVRAFANKVAKSTNMHISWTEIKGNDYNCEIIKSKVEALSAGTDDVIIFYYSGHGQSPKTNANDTTASKFPSFQCDDPEHPSPVGDLPNLEAISTLLRGKHARLTISVADSCNKLPIEFLQPKAYGPPVKRPPVDRLKTLFLDFQGYALLTSSSPDEFSYYSPTDNVGFFTQQLLENLQKPMPGVRDANVWSEALARSMTEIVIANPPAHQHPLSDANLFYQPRAANAARSGTMSELAATQESGKMAPATEKRYPKKKKKLHHHRKPTNANSG
ncbi:MAG: caspase family protein [Rhodomicrobium sp.]